MGGSNSRPQRAPRGAPPAAARICSMHRESDTWRTLHSDRSSLDRNLLRNPSANDGFSHWKVQSRGDGWTITDAQCCEVGAESKTFASSYGWCTKSQVVDLLAEGFSREDLDYNQPEICITDWYAPHPQFGGAYEIHVELMSADTQVIDEFKHSLPSLSCGSNGRYHQVSHVFRQYGPGVRLVSFEHKARDVLLRAGHYGARVTNSAVTVKHTGQLPLHHSLQSQRTSPPVTFWMELKLLPDELLLNVLSFVPAETLMLQCRCVCRKWQNLVDTPSLWLLKCERERRIDLLKAFKLCSDLRYVISWGRMYIKKPFLRNLLRNPCGKERMRHWEDPNRADRQSWIIEANRSHMEGAEEQTCFISTYTWCEKWQVVDLVQEGLLEELLDHHQPAICISDWYGGRSDCGCVYEIHVTLLASDKKRVIAEYKEKPEPIPQWNDQNYHQVSHMFHHYGHGVRFVKFLHRGKDTQYWAGYFGARITNSSVIVKIPELLSADPL